MRVGLVVLWAALATILLFVVGVLATLVIGGRIQLPGGDQPTPTVSATASAAPTVDPSYQVLVLNASPDVARTEEVKAKVIGAGYPAESVQTTEADETDFKTTTVYYISDADRAAARALATVLGVQDIAQSDTYKPSDGSTKQLTVVIGVDAGAGG